MKKGLKKLIAMASAISMLGATAGALAACNKGDAGPSFVLEKPAAGQENVVTYNTYTSVMPSNWNELTYQDNNDTQIMNYIQSAFFEYDYVFEGGKFSNNKVNAEGIKKDDFNVLYSAATALEDVTATVDAKWGYSDKQKAEGGFAWKVTLRHDLKWDDGTAIKAEDFVYSMKEQLDPAFQNYRADGYWENNVKLKGAKNYTYQGQSGIGWAAAYGTDYNTDKSSLKFNLDGVVDRYGFPSVDAIIPAIADIFDTEDEIAEFYEQWKGKGVEECLADTGKMKEFIEAWMEKSIAECDFSGDDYADLAYLFDVSYIYEDMDFEDVGLYAVDGDEYSLVICLDATQHWLKEDGSLSYLAPYSLSSLPLVKKSLYESCKQAPAEGSDLWTSTYNSSVATSASWGPYKLTQFQNGMSYTLEKNPYWYGWSTYDETDETKVNFKDQYLVDRIYCQKIAEENTAWMAFLSGCIDDIGIDVDHADDYRNSKYASFTPGSYTFSMHLNADLEKLSTGDRNNGILAIEDFRKALSLGIDRDDYATKTTTSYQAAYGLFNSSYYYDVVNNGIFRETPEAKAGLLRAYGYTENPDGTWSLSSSTTIKNLSLDVAYKTLKGYDLAQAKELVRSAYTELTTNASKYGYDSSKTIEIKYGTSADTSSTRRQYNYLSNMIQTLVEGTPLEGKIELTFDASFGTKWFEEFAAGNYDLCGGAWGGATFNPGYMLVCYLDPGTAYTPYFDGDKENLTFTMPVVDGHPYDGAGEEKTMSLMKWYKCLNGTAGDGEYDWSEGSSCPAAARLALIAKLEEVILQHYFSIPTTAQFSASLLGAKFQNVAEDYNTFMGYGGIQYLRVVRNDGEWYNFVVETNGRDLSTEYKKTDN